MRATREQIDQAITRESRYQDKKYGKGRADQRQHTIAEWMLIMEGELAEAKHAWLKETTEHALQEILQVITVGVRCLEEHGLRERLAVLEAEDCMVTSLPQAFTPHGLEVLNPVAADMIPALTDPGERSAPPDVTPRIVRTLTPEETKRCREVTPDWALSPEKSCDWERRASWEAANGFAVTPPDDDPA